MKTAAAGDRQMRRKHRDVCALPLANEYVAVLGNLWDTVMPEWN